MSIIQNTKLVVGLFLILGAFACEKVIEFDGEVKKPKIVINALFNTEDTFKVHLSKSLSLIDNGNLESIEKADVKVLDDAGQLVSEPKHVFNGVFRDLDFKPNSNSSYRIEVSSDGYDDVSAEDKTPLGVEILSLDTQIVRSPDGFEEFEVTVKFKDPPGDNLYMIDVLTRYEYDEFSRGNDQMWINTRDPNIENNSDPGGAYWGQRLVFNDDNFEGKEYSFIFNMETYQLRDSFFSNVNVRLSSLSSAAYNYFLSLEKYNLTYGNPFANPVQVYSNVENGFGIFGGAATHSINLKSN